jgi:hypothetical protein
MMRSWPALLLAPVLALTSITLGYALVTPACEHGHTWMLHASTAAFLAVCIALTAVSWRALRTARGEFVPLIATWTGALFSLVVLLQGLAQFMVPPCTS